MLLKASGSLFSDINWIQVLLCGKARETDLGTSKIYQI